MNVEKQCAHQLLDEQRPGQQAAMRILTSLRRCTTTGQDNVKAPEDDLTRLLLLRSGEYRTQFDEAPTGIRILRVRDRKEAYR
jgi:hypothetical protein